MSFRTRLADFIRGGNQQQSALMPIENSTPLPQITRGSSLYDAFVASYGGTVPLSEHAALAVSAIYACVNLIAGAIASLPVHIYKQNIENGERNRLFSDGLIWVLNEQMTPRWSAANGWEFLVQSLLLQGDGFARIIRNAKAEPVGLEPYHPRRVTVYVTPDLQRLVYAVDPEFTGSDKIILDQDDMIHFAGFGFDGVRGMSPLRNSLRIAGAASNAMQEFASNFFANSARPDYALTTEQALSKEAIDTLRAQIDERHKGYANSHRPMLLHSGLDIKTITMPMADIQFLEGRKFQTEEIARIYGVPPFMIGYNEKTTSWGSGIESMGTGFVRYSLRQHLNKIQTELDRKLFRTASRTAIFDTTDLERADTKSFYEGLRIAVGRAGERPLISVDEARAELRRNKRGMDSLDPIAAPQGTPPNDPQQTA